MGQSLSTLHPGAIVHGPLLPEPIELIAVVELGTARKLIGRGTKTNRVYDPVLNEEQLGQLAVSARLALLTAMRGCSASGWKRTASA